MGVPGDRVRVEVLGPLRVLDQQGRDLTPTGDLQRRLLALLVLRRGRTVSVDAAVGALWPGRAPRDPVAAVQNHMFRLRRGLPEGLVGSVGDGYRLDPAGVEVDADRLTDLLGAGPGDEAVLAQVDALLERWRGPAYVELEDVDEGRDEAARLAELRVRARELRAEARLARADTDGLVADLVALVEAEPLRERPRALLMAALAATGRHAEALQAYDDFRRLLGDQLGIDPSPALAAQHAKLLSGVTGAGWTPAGRLPAPATSLVGRDSLVAEVTGLAQVERLVTLVGPGGVGKTRLLLEVGRGLVARQADRPVVLSELAPADPGSAVGVVAAALGVDARPGAPLVERIADLLSDAEAVLLLDNCEHVLDPVSELVELLLARCPGVRVVATSRERLRVPGEQVRAVPPLRYDGEDAPAVRLFEDRARDFAPGFDPDPRQQAWIAEIARRLDGLPLAIELAAARLHTHDVEEIASGLDHRFALLASGFRTSPRHGSLHAAVSWSYGLLDEGLRRTFAELSVFSASFGAGDAAAVCGVDRQAAELALAQLVERSLVMRAPGRRYLLLETLRAFGHEQLDRSGRLDVVAGRHARHQVGWVERAAVRTVEPGGSALAEIDAAVPELRTALGWLLDHDEVELAGRLVGTLLYYGTLRLRPDVLAWARRVTEADPDDRSPCAAQVWVAAAYAAWMAGDLAATGRCSERALRAAERAGREVPPDAMTARGSFALFEGNLPEAVRWYRRAAEAAAATGDRTKVWWAAGAELLALGYAGDPAYAALAQSLLAEVGDAATPYAAYVWYCAGEADLAVGAERARHRLSQALRLAELTGTSFVTGLAGASLASIDAQEGDPRAAAQDFRRLLLHWRRAGVWSTQWTMLRSVAGLLARLGRDHDAAVLEGAIRATAHGHRIFGADEVALTELSERLCRRLGEGAWLAARREGALLDGEAAVEHALRAL